MKTVEDLTYLIIQAAIEVHTQLGPGLLEKIYEKCLFIELELRGLTIQRQVRLPVSYKGHTIGGDLRIDLLVDNRIVIEVKAASENHPLHKAQALTYLKLSGHRHGLVINFGLLKLVDGVRSVING